MKKILDKIKNTKILGIIGNIVVIISLFMATVVVESKTIGFKASIQYISGDGKFILVLSVINLIIIFADKISPTFFKGLTNIKLTVIPTLIEIIILINFTVKSGNISEYDYASWHWGIGFYLMWIGVILSMICPFIYKEEPKNELSK